MLFLRNETTSDERAGRFAAAFLVTGSILILLGAVGLEHPLSERTRPQILLLVSPEKSDERSFFSSVQQHLVSQGWQANLVVGNDDDLYEGRIQLAGHPLKRPTMVVQTRNGINRAAKQNYDFYSQMRKHGISFVQVEEPDWARPCASLQFVSCSRDGELRLRLTVQQIDRLSAHHKLEMGFKKSKSVASEELSLSVRPIDHWISKFPGLEGNFTIDLSVLKKKYAGQSTILLESTFRDFRPEDYDQIQLWARYPTGELRLISTLELWSRLRTLYIPVDFFIDSSELDRERKAWSEYRSLMNDRRVPFLTSSSGQSTRLLDVSGHRLRKCDVLDSSFPSLDSYERIVIDCSYPRGIHNQPKLSEEAIQSVRLIRQWITRGGQALLVGEGKLPSYVASVLSGGSLTGLYEENDLSRCSRRCIFVYDQTESSMNAREFAESRLITLPYAEPPISPDESDASKSFRERVFPGSKRIDEFDEATLWQQNVEFDSKTSLGRFLMSSIVGKLDYFGFDVEVNGEALWMPSPRPNQGGNQYTQERPKLHQIDTSPDRIIDSVEELVIKDYAQRVNDWARKLSLNTPVFFACTDGDDPGSSSDVLTRDESFIPKTPLILRQDSNRMSLTDSMMLLQLKSSEGAIIAGASESSDRDVSQSIPYTLLKRLQTDPELSSTFHFGGRHRLSSFIQMIFWNRLASRRNTVSLQTFIPGIDRSGRVGDVLSPFTYDRLVASVLPFGKSLPRLNEQSQSKSTDRGDLISLYGIGDGRLLLAPGNSFAESSLASISFFSQASDWSDWIFPKDSVDNGTECKHIARLSPDIGDRFRIALYEIDQSTLLPKPDIVPVKNADVQIEHFLDGKGTDLRNNTKVDVENADDGVFFKINMAFDGAAILKLHCAIDDKMYSFRVFLPWCSSRIESTDNWTGEILLAERVFSERPIEDNPASIDPREWQPQNFQELVTAHTVRLPIRDTVAPILAHRLNEKLLADYRSHSSRNWILWGMILSILATALHGWSRYSWLKSHGRHVSV